MFDKYPRFDMDELPRSPKLGLLSYLIALPGVISHGCRIRKYNMKGIKPPYLLLGNHNAFMDIKVTFVATYPYKKNYVIAIDGYLGREQLIRNIGGICKRKFTHDLRLIDHIKYALDQGRIAVIFPEARYSLCGTTAIIPPSVARLCSYLKVPVVTLTMHGHHINSPFWNLHDRHVKGIEAELRCIVRKDEIEQLSLEEIDERIQSVFQYDDYAWQKEKGIRVHYPKRAEGLHKVLYKCPHCLTEYQMSTKGKFITCNHCGKSYRYMSNGELHAVDGDSKFTHIPDWYEWERSEVRKEIENGTYHFDGEVHVMMLPNAEKYIPIGNARLIHDMDGFHLSGEFEGEKYLVELPAQQTYGVHIEYEYLGKYGDCVDLNTLDNTYYVYPHGNEFAVTKFSLATEELFKYYAEKRENK